MMISSLTETQLLQVVEEYEALKKGSLSEKSFLTKIAGGNAISMTITGLSCYRELYLRGQRNA